jgi:hypothetical protein
MWRSAVEARYVGAGLFWDGVALRDGSPWRKPVDRGLLHRLASPA